MDYNTLDKSKVYIILSTSNSWVSSVIRWFTRSKFSHSAFLLYDTRFQKWQIAGADATGFELTSLDNFLSGNQMMAIYSPPVDLNKALPEIDDWLGTFYNYSGLLGMAWVELGHWLKKKWSNPLDNPHEMFCSEAIARALESLKCPDFTAAPDTLAPEDLNEVLSGQLKLTNLLTE